jgi:acetolactate synthase I/II/III large subunit
MLHKYKKSLTGGKIVYNKLLEHNVEDVFMYSGGAIMPLVDAFYRGPIRYYVNNHEQNCGHAATGYAKSSGKTGVFVVTSGPGITNSVTPLLDATNDSTPLIAFSGNVSLKSIGTNAFQEAPAVEITKSVTKWSYCVKDVSELPDVIDEAFKIANHRKKGSVHIDLPKCVISNQFSQSENGQVRRIPDIQTTTYIDTDHLKKTIALIHCAKKPILYVGKGCLDVSDKLLQFVEQSNIPITTTLHAMGIIDETHPLSLKMCGMHGSVYSNYALQDSDCIIALGSRFDDRTTGNLDYYAPNAKNGGIIHVNIEPTEIGKVVDSTYNFASDCGIFLDTILPLIEYRDRSEWISQIAKWKCEHPHQYIKPQGSKIKTQQFLVEINKHIRQRNDIICTTGVGNHQMMACQFIDWKTPRQIVSSGSLGVMGVGLPYAIGVQIAHPDKCVVNIDGDSSFMMTFGDLKTVKEHNLPIKIFICNNHSQDMVRVWEKLFFNDRITATKNKFNPNFTQLAESFGIKAVSCDNIDKLESIVSYVMNHNGPILCEIQTEPDYCLPLVAPGKALNDMILINDYNSISSLDGEAPC